MLPRLKLNPVNAKRVQRFKKHRRAYVSLLLMVGIYIVCLGAELIANRNPYYVRYEGKSYFPFLAAYNDNVPFVNDTWEWLINLSNPEADNPEKRKVVVFSLGVYPQDVFLGDGINVQPNYKLLDRDPRFADNPDNYMIWPPVPFGDREIIPESLIELSPDVTVDCKPAPQVATLDMDPEFMIVRSINTNAVLPNAAEDAALAGEPIADLFDLPIEIKAALLQAFNNRPVAETEAHARTKDGVRVIIRVRAYEPRDAAPAKLRLRVEEDPGDKVERHQIMVPPSGVPYGTDAFWDSLAADQREQILAQALLRMTEPVQPDVIRVNEKSWRISYEREDVRYPFRPIDVHIMGIDDAGRDVFVRILYATRLSLNFGFILVTATFVLGILIGAIQGFMGGIVDIATQRLIEIWGALPFLYVIIFLGAVMGRSFTLLLVVYAVFNWIGISYYMRGEFLKLRQEPYVDAARVLGIPSWKIVLRHILPNALVPVITFFPFSLVGAIGILSALDYLGFGLPPPTPSWGELLAQGQSNAGAWWLTLYPFLALFTVILLGVFIGEGIRAAFDPRNKTHLE